MGSGERNAQMLVFQESDEDLYMGFFDSLLGFGKNKVAELQGYRDAARSLSDRDLLRETERLIRLKETAFGPGMKRSACWEEVKKRGLDAELRKRVKF